MGMAAHALSKHEYMAFMVLCSTFATVIPWHENIQCSDHLSQPPDFRNKEPAQAAGQDEEGFYAYTAGPRSFTYLPGPSLWVLLWGRKCH